MPRVKLDYVVSFSSEDSENQANNLLAHEVSKKKWLCPAGEPSCSVVLQLTRAVQITTVQVGACHAALVEVLVGRSEKPNDQFEVLVPSSVFMSPLESRKDSGTEKVRSFTGDQLSEARERRWDRIRIVCSQPYNKHCKYGLSFIHIFEPEDKTRPEQNICSVAPAVPRRMMLVDNFSSDEDDFKPGEMFANHQLRVSEGGLDTGAQIRQASSQALKNISNSSTKLVKTPITKTNTNRPNQSNHADTNRQKDTLMYTDDDEQPHSKIDAVVNRHKNDKEIEAKKEQPKKQDTKVRKHEANSSLFKDFLDNDKKKDSNSSRSKESSKDDRRKDVDSSRSKNNRDDGRNDLNSSRNKDNSRDERRKDLNNSRNYDDRRNRDDERTPPRKRTDDISQNRESKKRPHSGEKAKSKEVLKPGPVSSTPHTLMSGVIFALSGYENPRRAKLRDAAVAMGARFERDWSPACTHLICAFPNTPKLRTVRSAQRPCVAVLGEWVESCCEHRRLLPWQWFATEAKHKVTAPATWPEEEASGNTECDTDDEIEKVLRKQKRRRVDSSPSPSRDASPQPHCSKDLSPQPHRSKGYSRDRSPKSQTGKEKSPKMNASREDTAKRKNTSNISNMSTDSDVVFTKDERFQGNVTIDSDSDETDEEKPVSEERVDKGSVLPDFFEGYTFVIDNAVEREGFDAQLLARYVKAYGGVVVDASQLDSDSDISYVLSAGPGAGDAASGGRRVRPDWVWRCHEQQTLCDTDEFAL